MMDWLDTMTCPYCLKSQDDEYNESGSRGYRKSCDSCGKEFEVEEDYTIHYSMKKLDCVNKIVPHSWEHLTEHVAYPEARHCKLCNETQWRKQDYKD